MKVLLAVDGSECSAAAVKEVAARPWPEGSLVKIIAAVRLPFVPTAETSSLPDSDYSRIERAEMEQAQAAIAKALAHLKARQAAPLALESATIIGDARAVILDEAARWQADLIVLGSRGMNALDRFLLGSVSQAVATHATCSVEIVRQPQYESSAAQ